MNIILWKNKSVEKLFEYDNKSILIRVSIRVDPKLIIHSHNNSYNIRQEADFILYDKWILLEISTRNRILILIIPKTI